MDLRCSPRESCGSHLHLVSCDACRGLLEEFCVLHQSLESFCVVSNDRVFETVSVCEYVEAEPAFDSRLSTSKRKRFYRYGRRFPDPLAVTVCAILLCAFFLGSQFWTTDSYSPPVANRASPSRLNSNLLAISTGSVMPEFERKVVSEPAQQFEIPWRLTAVSSRTNKPVHSFASCIRIADQMPGVPPIRWSVTQTVNWFWNSIPALPRIPAWPQFMPEFGQFEQARSVQMA